MKLPFLQEILQNRFFFRLLSLGPLLLITQQVLPSLLLVAVILLQSVILYVVRLLNARWNKERYWFMTELLVLSVFTALFDYLFLEYAVVLRSSLGLLLPYSMFQVLFFFRNRENIARNKALSSLNLPASIVSYCLVLVILACIREILTFGSIQFNNVISADRIFALSIHSLQESNRAPLLWNLASTTSALFFIFAIVHVIRERK